MTKQIFSFEIVDHGVEHAQYFQGHGVAYTEWTDCSTGVGRTPGEALEDALEQMADMDVAESDIEKVKRCPDADLLRASEVDAHDECRECRGHPASPTGEAGQTFYCDGSCLPSDWHDGCELSYRVSIDWRYGQ